MSIGEAVRQLEKRYNVRIHHIHSKELKLNTFIIDFYLIRYVRKVEFTDGIGDEYILLSQFIKRAWADMLKKKEG